MNEMFVEIGEQTVFSKTITDADFAAFSSISSDFDPVHVNEEYAKTTSFGRRIAHGLAVLSLMSGPESEMSRRIVERGCVYKPVTLGYDKVRFIKPVFCGDTLTATYTIAAIDSTALRAIGKCEITNQHDELVVFGNHVLKWVE
jgi:acyl dehydratase